MNTDTVHNAAETPLGFALGLEVRGVGFYLDLAVKTRNPLAKELYYQLAEEEIQHARRIDAIHAAAKPAALPHLPAVEARMKRFYESAPQETLRRDAEQFTGYELAMKMEKESYETYRRFRDEARTDSEKAFFAALMKEEEKHFEALENVHAYLTQPGEWLREDESRVWNWMNLG